MERERDSGEFRVRSSDPARTRGEVICPVCAIGHPPKEMAGLSETDWRVKTGRIIPGVELRITDDDGAVQPWDGESLG